MSDVVLTIVDTVGIQKYIFGSNRLRENIGASYLVKQATREWVYENLPEPNNIADQSKGSLDPEKQVVRDDLAAELVYTGGGNAVILFRSPDEARSFARDLSHKVFTEAPGLEIVIAHTKPFNWSPEANDLRDEMKKLREHHLERKKHTGQATLTPLLGLGVTAECAATGLVATHRIEDPEKRFVSDEIYAKSQASRAAKERLRNEFDKADPQRQFDFSDELDHLSRTAGEESYIAVVHIDGNDVGSLFTDCGQGAANNRDYIERLRRLSDGIEEASNKAMIHMLKRLTDHITRTKLDDETTAWEVNEAPPELAPSTPRVETQRKKIRLYQESDAENKQNTSGRKRSNNKPYWPVIPLVFGGDDMTFVCNGQLGLSLAVICMKAFASQTKKLLGKAIHTSAGISIVKVHYPFRRAYELSESLIFGAKKLLGKERPHASALDWHISTTGLSGSLPALRAREYTVDSGSLLMRPVWLSPPEKPEWRTWETFNRLVGEFNFSEHWVGRRNKLKALREALRAGESAVEEFRKIYFQRDKLSLPQIPGPWFALHERGWEGERCIYFDALEAMDHHILLEDSPDDGTD